MQPEGARERGQGQSRHPGCDQRSGHDLHPHPTATLRLTHPDQAKPQSALPAFGLPWPLGRSWYA
jgi:hypothetical protein